MVVRDGGSLLDQRGSAIFDPLEQEKCGRIYHPAFELFAIAAAVMLERGARFGKAGVVVRDHLADHVTLLFDQPLHACHGEFARAFHLKCLQPSDTVSRECRSQRFESGEIAGRDRATFEPLAEFLAFGQGLNPPRDPFGAIDEANVWAEG